MFTDHFISVTASLCLGPFEEELPMRAGKTGWLLPYWNPAIAWGTYGPSSNVISWAESFRVTAARASSRCCSLVAPPYRIFSTRPRISSLVPSEYTFAVSKKLMPPSRARFMKGRFFSSLSVQR